MTLRTRIIRWLGGVPREEADALCAARDALACGERAADAEIGRVRARLATAAASLASVTREREELQAVCDRNSAAMDAAWELLRQAQAELREADTMTVPRERAARDESPGAEEGDAAPGVAEAWRRLERDVSYGSGLGHVTRWGEL